MTPEQEQLVRLFTAATAVFADQSGKVQSLTEAERLLELRAQLVKSKALFRACSSWEEWKPVSAFRNPDQPDRACSPMRVACRLSSTSSG